MAFVKKRAPRYDGFVDGFIHPTPSRAIIENAIQHGVAKLSRVGRVQIRVNLEAANLVLVVEDNGVGMDEKQLSLLRNSLSQTEPSSGIGLSNVARRLLIYYQGKALITLESALMKGKTVTIRIPVTH